jgi:hypothetical protein
VRRLRPTCSTSCTSCCPRACRSEVMPEADGVVSQRLERPDGGEVPPWSSGCHLDLVLPSGRLRQYSLCGDPAERNHYRVAIRRIEDGGSGSREVHELAPGTLLTVRRSHSREQAVPGRTDLARCRPGAHLARRRVRPGIPSDLIATLHYERFSPPPIVGFCGTCPVSLLGGDIEHRDRCLTEPERATQFALCVSRGSGRITVDLYLTQRPAARSSATSSSSRYVSRRCRCGTVRRQPVRPKANASE